MDGESIWAVGRRRLPSVGPSGWSRELLVWFGLLGRGGIAPLACVLIGTGVAAATEEPTQLKSKALK